VRRTGTSRERVDSSYAAVRGDDPSLPWLVLSVSRKPLVSPFGGAREPTSCAHLLPKKQSFQRSPCAQTGPIQAKVRAAFRRASPLLEPDRTPHCRARMRARRADPFTLSCTHRRSPVPHRPAKGGAFARRPRRVPPSYVLCDFGDRSPKVRKAEPPSTRHLCSGERRHVADRESPRLVGRPLVPGVTHQAPVAARSNGARGGLRSPSRNRSIAAPKNGFCDRRPPAA